MTHNLRMTITTLLTLAAACTSREPLLEDARFGAELASDENRLAVGIELDDTRSYVELHLFEVADSQGEGAVEMFADIDFVGNLSVIGEESRSFSEREIAFSRTNVNERETILRGAFQTEGHVVNVRGTHVEDSERMTLVISFDNIYAATLELERLTASRLQEDAEEYE